MSRDGVQVRAVEVDAGEDEVSADVTLVPLEKKKYCRVIATLARDLKLICFLFSDLLEQFQIKFNKMSQRSPRFFDLFMDDSVQLIPRELLPI